MPELVVEVPDHPGWSSVEAGSVHLIVQSTESSLVDALRVAAADGDVEALTSALGAAEPAPDFVAVLVGDTTRVLTRGIAYAVGLGPAGPVEFRGSSGPSWDDDEAPAELEEIQLRPGVLVLTGGTSSAGSPAAGPATGSAPSAQTASRSSGVSLPDLVLPGAQPAAPAPGTPSTPGPPRAPAPEAPATTERESPADASDESGAGGADRPATASPTPPGPPAEAARPQRALQSGWQAPSLLRVSQPPVTAPPVPAPAAPAPVTPAPSATPAAASATAEVESTPEPVTPAPPEPQAAPEPAAAQPAAPAAPAPQDPAPVAQAPAPEPVQPPVSPPTVEQEVEELPSYDHLFGATEHARPRQSMVDTHDTQGISEAPIGHAPIEAAGGATPAPPIRSDLTLPPPPEAERPSRGTPGTTGSASAPVPPTEPPAAPKRGGIIDSVPWRGGGSNVAPAPQPPREPQAVPPAPTPAPLTPPPVAPAAPAPQAPAPQAPAPQAPAPQAPAPQAPAPQASPPAAPAQVPPPAPGWGPPVPRQPTTGPGAIPASAPSSSPAPAVPPASAVSPAPDAQDSRDDGVDDATVDRSSLQAGSATQGGPMVQAVLCPAGHSSPPHSGTCRLCGREIPAQQPFQTPRPVLGLLRLASGDVVQLDRGVLLGRSPKVNAELSAAERPHLVRVTSPQNDISRNHVEIVLEGWHVLIRDLGSTNGTTVALPGQPPVRLRPSDQQVIEPGTVITLADEVSLTYEVGS